MDVLTEEQTIQDVLGHGLIDSALNQLESYLRDDKQCLPEEAIAAAAYNQDGRPHHLPQSALPQQLDPCFKLSNLNNFHAPVTSAPHNSLHAPVTSSPPQTQGHSLNGYNCPPRYTDGPQGYDNPLIHPTLPDSPPDSEPYSPPDGHRNAQTVNAQSNHGLTNHSNNAISQESKYGIVNPATTMHQHMYPPHHRPPGLLPHAHKMPPGYNEPLNHLPATHPAPQSSTPLPLPPTQANPSIPLSPPHLSPVNGCNKKRKFSDSPNSSLTNALLAGRNGVLNIKQEPNGSGFMNSYIGDCDDDFGYDPENSSTGYLDSSYQVIKWSQYLQKEWATLKNEQLKDIPPPSYRVDADKGFNFSQPDDSFVCQKKNHFQVTVHTLVNGEPKYVTTPDGVKKVDSFHLHFFGIKMESQTQTIKIEQSQSDRSKKPFYPVRVDLIPDQTNKITVGRLHFSETTANNMRKKGRPNPDQRYFMLVVGLYAHSGENKFLVAGSVSEKIIVRASNPGQFDNDVDVNWQKGQTGDSVFHVGRVGINTDHPEEALTVHGNMSLTGRMYQPSDIRAKENLKEVNSRKQLENLSKLKIYEYNYSEDFADTVGIPETNRKDTGVIAQEVKDILPDAVRETGDVPLPNGDVIENLLVVDKERVFMENVGAVKELCKLTDNLEVRIDELEKMNKKLAKLKRYDSLKSTVSSKSSCSVSTVSSSPPKKSSSSPSSSASKYNHNRHKSSSRKPADIKPATDNGWCSNRFIQVTIFTLILIMALCLIAITILYILERQRETNHITTTSHNLAALPTQAHQGHSTHAPRPTSRKPSVNMSATTISPQMGPSTVLPMSQFPPYPPCDPQRQLCERKCCPPPTQDDGEETPIVTYSYSPYRVSDSQISLPILPPYPPCDPTRELCHRECCPPPFNSNPTNYSVQYRNDSNRFKYHVFTEPAGSNTLPNDQIKATHTTMPSNIAVNTLNPKDNNIPQVVINTINESNLHDPEVKYDDPGNLDNNQIKVVYYRYKRSASPVNVDLHTQIWVKELNVTVGSEFCTYCNSTSKQFRYSIKLSQYFSYEPITLEFSTRSETVASLCYNHTQQDCQTSQPSELDDTVPNQWKIPIGKFFSSSFIFRVAHKETMNACSLDKILSGVQYAEFRLDFHRTCDQGGEL